MMIVDAQIHLWAKGKPSAHHRQTPFLKDEALAAMDAAGVDRAVIHPVMWDPDSNELAVEAARAHPDRFAIMGWFYLDDAEQRIALDRWKSRPGTWRECVTLFTEELLWLKGADLELVMGQAFCDWIGWRTGHLSGHLSSRAGEGRVPLRGGPLEEI